MGSFMAIMILILLNLGCVYLTGFFTLDGENIFLLLLEKDFGEDNKDFVRKSYHHQIFLKFLPLFRFPTQNERHMTVDHNVKA